MPGCASSAHSLTVSVQPQCTIACINTYAQVENPRHWQPYTIVWTHENTTHTDINGYSTALEATVLYPVITTRISRKGQGRTKKEKEICIVLQSYSSNESASPGNTPAVIVHFASKERQYSTLPKLQP